MIFTKYKNRIYTSFFLLLLLLLIFNFSPVLVYSLIVLSLFAFFEFFNITKKIISNKFIYVITNLSFILYIFIFCLIFFYFVNNFQLKPLMFSLLFCCIGSDIGGFIFGKIFKGPKLTKISPKKTFSGALGSIIFSNIFFSYLIFIFINKFFYVYLIIATITSICCQIGDLFFSYLKRKAKIKDTGNFLPGHGGVLDRIDGILLGVPLGLISLILFF